jgi:uncharacterized membrane protein YgcG
MLSRLQQGYTSELLPYERKLLDALFDDAETVKLSELKGKFNDDLQDVKELLYRESVKQLKFFPRDPEGVRGFYRTFGGIAIGVGAALGWVLGTFLGLGLLAAPVLVGGLGLVLGAPVMPRRSASGWETYRRCLGFRLYMVTAETDRQRFAEQENIFHEYLPYAIVYGCVDKWAKAFEGLGLEDKDVYWYSGAHGFAPARFAASVNSFSTSITGVMAATPGGSGGSGFSGGGFSGGGVGGGGGSSW